MNPFDLDATQLLVWGLVIHCVCDWLLQNDWMARNKARRRPEPDLLNLSKFDQGEVWWDRHPAAYVHAGIHGLGFALIFGWVAIPIAVTHLLIDTRTPVAWFANLIKQTGPDPKTQPPTVDVGTLVRFNVDQVWHVVVIAIAALVVGS